MNGAPNDPRRVLPKLLRSGGALAILLGALVVVVAAPRKARAQEEFLRGDVNTDGRVSVSDALMLRRWLFNGDRSPSCHHAADFDDSGNLNIADTIRLLNYLILGGDPPAAPYPDLGLDTTGNEYPWGCESYSVVEPLSTDDTVRILPVEGAPGEEVRIPILVSNSIEVEAFQFVVRYDAEIIDVLPFNTQEYDHWAGTYYEGGTEIGYMAIVPHPEEGMFVVGWVPSLIETGFELPPGEDVAVLNAYALIRSDVPPGTTTLLEPTNGRDGEGFGPAGLRNELTHRGEARFVSVEPRLEGGIMKIVVDQVFFRGDSNRDGELDLSDAVYSLDFLFTGGPRPLCMDAADSNDDGKVDISDPIYALSHLFLGGPALPQPFPDPGRDPTPDDPLGCLGATD